MKRLAAILVVLAWSSPLASQERIDYRFEQVRRKVTLSNATVEVAATTGAPAQSGDRVRTGWLGYALLAAPRYAARFELFAGSDVRLASDTPGVLLSLERGRLKAAFDKFTGNEPRMVQTPGALLAVGGTRYGVEVGADGFVTVSVFDGIVAVVSPLQREPLFVRAGESCSFSRDRKPESQPMRRGMTEQMWDRHGSRMREGGMMTEDHKRGGREMPDSRGNTNTNRGRSGSGHHNPHR